MQLVTSRQSIVTHLRYDAVSTTNKVNSAACHLQRAVCWCWAVSRVWPSGMTVCHSQLLQCASKQVLGAAFWPFISFNLQLAAHQAMILKPPRQIKAVWVWEAMHTMQSLTNMQNYQTAVLASMQPNMVDDLLRPVRCVLKADNTVCHCLKNRHE